MKKQRSTVQTWMERISGIERPRHDEFRLYFCCFFSIKGTSNPKVMEQPEKNRIQSGGYKVLEVNITCRSKQRHKCRPELVVCPSYGV